MQYSTLEGTWDLISYELHLADGIVLHPMGEGVRGILMYGAGRRVAVQLMDPDRPNFQESDWLKGTPEEIKAAFEGSLAYFGTYELEEEKGMIVHHIRGCTFPNWVNTDQRRILELEGDRLTLITPPLHISGEELVGRLSFRRAR